MTKFSLKMPDGMDARNLEELKAHFDLDSVLGYYYDGRLLKWLESRDYVGNTVSAVRALDKDAAYLKKQLAEIFGVEIEFSDEKGNTAEFRERNAKIAKLKQWTDNVNILENVDSVAFDQEELEDLLDDDVSPVYLCGTSFDIPLGKENITYIGVKNPIVNIFAKEQIDFVAKGIVFDGITFCEDYQKILQKVSITLSENSRGSVRVIRAKDPVYEYNGKYYFHDGETIYSINKDGTYKIRIYQTEHSPSIRSNLQVNGNGIYFAGYGSLFNVSLDGTNKKEYSVDYDINEILFTNSWIYYTTCSRGIIHDDCCLKKMSIDGKNTDTIVKDVMYLNNLHLVEKDIFYTCNGKLYKLPNDENSPRLLFDIRANKYNSISIGCDAIYLLSVDDIIDYVVIGYYGETLIGGIASIDFDGKNYNKLSTEITGVRNNDKFCLIENKDRLFYIDIDIMSDHIHNEILVHNNYIYYLDATKVQKKKIEVENKIKHIIDIGEDYPASGFCLIDDSIFVQRLDHGSLKILYQYNLDGQKLRSLY